MDKDDPAEQLYVWRVMIDERYQRLGLGRQTMAWVVDEARRMGLPEIGLSHVQANTVAGRFYESLGFQYSGEVDDGERKMRLVLNQGAESR